MPTATLTLPCNRCGGNGILPRHLNVQGGICFACQGKGVRTATEQTAREDARREMAAAGKAARRDARHAKLDTYFSGRIAEWEAKARAGENPALCAEKIQKFQAAWEGEKRR